MNYVLAILMGAILAYLNVNFWSALVLFSLVLLAGHEPSKPYVLVMTLILVAYMVLAYWNSKDERP